LGVKGSLAGYEQLPEQTYVTSFRNRSWSSPLQLQWAQRTHLR
jgi:hypothetical protein